jgi:uncharacterized membrane protein YeiH
MADLPNIAASTPLWLALLTTGVGAVEGAIIARRPGAASFDIVGIFVFAVFLGLGGGMARDALLGNTPFVALRTPWYILTVTVSAVLVLVVGRYIEVTSKGFVLLDSLTLGLYAEIGTQEALDFKVPIAGAVIVGMFASLTGGAVVSILRREVPAIIRPGSPYALLSLAGVLAFLALTPLNGPIAAIACIGVVIIGRFAVLRLDVETAPVKPLTEP